MKITRSPNDLLPQLANKEIYSFWDKLPENIKYTIETFSIGDLILKVIKEYNIVGPERLHNLYKITQIFPGSFISNIGGMPVLTIKKIN